MPVRGSFELKGLETYLERLAAARVDLDRAVTDVLTEAAPVAEQELTSALLKTRQPDEVWTGETESTIVSSEVGQEGNYQFVEVRVGGPAAPQAIYKEYGTVRQAAEPFFRPAFRKLRQGQVKKMLKQVLQRFGLLP